MSKQKKNAKKPAASKTAGKKKSVKAKTKKEKIALLERMIAALQNRLKKLKRDNSPARNEFRYNFDNEHKQYVFEEIKGKYNSLGLTHEAETFGKKNMPLGENPQKGKTEKAYVRNGVVSGKKRSYGKPMKNYKFSEADMGNVKAKIRNYKKSRKRRQKK